MRKLLFFIVLFSCVFCVCINAQDGPPQKEEKENDPLESLYFGPIGPNKTLEQVSKEISFLADYFDKAKNQRKPLIFFWQYRGHHHDRSMDALLKNKNLVKMALIEDSRAFYPEEESEERSDIRRTMCYFSGNDSFYADYYGARVITPEGQFLSFDGTDLERQIPLFYAMACERKLKKQKDYKLYETVANSLQPHTRQQFVRSKYIRKSTYPSPVGQYVAYAAKKDTFVFLYIGAYGKKDVRDMKVKEKELEERFPGVMVKVLPNDSDVLPVLFDVLPDEIGTKKFGMLIAPEGTKYIHEWTPSMVGPSHKLLRDAQNLITAGKYQKALMYVNVAAMFHPEGYAYAESQIRSVKSLKSGLKKKLGIEEEGEDARTDVAADKRVFDDTIVFKNYYPTPLEDIINKGKFLETYMTSSQRVRKPLVFVMAQDIKQDFLTDYMEEKKFKAYGILQDVAPDMEKTDLDHRYFSDLIAKYTLPDSIFYGTHVSGFIMYPDRKTIHAFYCYPWMKRWGGFLQVALYLEAVNLKLNGNKEYRRFQELAKNVYADDENGVYNARKDLIKNLTLHPHMDNLIKASVKDNAYALARIMTTDRAETAELKEQRVELRKMFPSFKTYVYPVQSGLRPLIFNRRGVVRWNEDKETEADFKHREELAVMTGPEGILAVCTWAELWYYRGGFRIFLQKCLDAYEKGDKEQALKFLTMAYEFIPQKDEDGWPDYAQRDTKKVRALISGVDPNAKPKTNASDRPVVKPESKKKPAPKKEDVESF